MESFTSSPSRHRTTATKRIVRDGQLRLAGGTIAYTMAGSGPALLLIHGLGGNRHTWQPLLDGLARTHTVIAPDLPGHGESDAFAGDYSLGTHASTLRDLLLALGHRRVSIAGHSLGGAVALQTAYQFPERIERLMLISSGGLGSEVSNLLRAATLPGAETVIAALSKIPAGLTERILPALRSPVSEPDAHVVADVLRGFGGEQQRREFIGTARAVNDWRGQTVSATRHIGLLRGVPVFVAWGADDSTIPPRHHLALAARIPHAVTAEITDAGHYPHETASAQVLSAMETFLSSSQPFRYSEAGWIEQLTASPIPSGEIENSQDDPDTAADERGDAGIEDLQSNLESRRTVDTAIGILAGLRGCSEREADHEFVGAVNETGITSAELGRALADVVSGREPSLKRAEPLHRWSRLLEARGHAVRVRYGPNESNIC